MVSTMLRHYSYTVPGAVLSLSQRASGSACGKVVYYYTVSLSGTRSRVPNPTGFARCSISARDDLSSSNHPQVLRLLNREEQACGNTGETRSKHLLAASCLPCRAAVCVSICRYLCLLVPDLRTSFLLNADYPSVRTWRCNQEGKERSKERS